jgi:hypothetical protein
MLIKTTVREARELTKEVEPPYYAQDFDTYFRVNEDGSILRIAIFMEGGAIKGATIGLHESNEYVAGEVIKARPVERKFVLNALKKSLQYIETQVFKFETTLI